MAEPASSSTLIARLITPILLDIYKNAKGHVQKSLIKWNTESGIKTVAAQLSRLDKVKTIWSPEKEISLRKFYHPSTIRTDYVLRVVDSVEDLPLGNLVVEGIVGQGKSIFMRHLATSSIHSHSIIIPVFIELRDISTKRSLSDCIKSFLKNFGLEPSPEVIAHLAKSGRLCLLLDGFDEIPSDCVPDTLKEINELSYSYDKLKIIISSRPRSTIQNAIGFEVITLADIDTSEYEKFISKLIPAKAKRAEMLYALEDCNENIKGVIRTPLMITLVVMIYQTQKDIPSTLSGFFDKLFGVVFSKHDKLKAGFNRQHNTKLSEDQLKELFEIFCFMATYNKIGRSMSSSEFDETFTLAAKFNKNLNCRNQDFRTDIINVACLILEEGLDTLTFLHKSILDYYAAAFIKKMSDTKAAEFYEMAFKRFDQWQHALQFLREIDSARFAKEYTLKTLPSALHELSQLLETRHDSELVEYIKRLAPGLSVSFGEHGANEVSRQPMRANELHYDILVRLQNALLRQCRNASQAHVTRAAIRIGVDRHGRKTMVRIPFHIVITEFGSDVIWEMLTIVENSACLRISEAQNLIENEEEKDGFLDSLFADT
ncbi:NACHT domain-containing protein [Pseudomonas sp. UBA7721]|uniref:NACHT domain-containing protein n=1 Tax=Pseudomonas sp. UBA7721 TaxID=1947343 RepID=UPI00257BDC30|nr:NACHT domain-containing protein [Pseudomonas sp. UBA7721]